MIGQTIADRYHIEALLGRGGMGAVYRAADRVENRPVALKSLHYTMDDAETAHSRFNREFRVLARLDHPSIVRAYDYGTYHNAPYLVLELLEGQTLADKLAAGPLTRARLLQIARQISQAHAWGLLGYIRLISGHVDETIQAMEEALRLSEQANLLHLLLTIRADLSWLYGSLGAMEQGLELARQALAAAKEQDPVWQSHTAAVLARLHLLNRDLTAAEAALKESYSGLPTPELNSIGVVLMALAEAELGLLTRDYGRVHHHLDALLGRLHQLNIRIFVPKTLHLKGQILLAQGRVDEARQTLAEARREAETMQARLDLWPILATLSRLEAEHGQAGEAEQLRRQASAIIDYIADHAPPDLRSSFLALPQVRVVLGKAPAS